MIVTSHAVDALALFYPRTADEESVRDEVSRGVAVEGGTAIRLVGRQNLRPGSNYILHRERTGLFVLAGQTVVTFLRFYALSQHELACTLWPGGDPPTCEARWLRAVIAVPSPAPQKAAKTPKPAKAPKPPPPPELAWHITDGARRATGKDRTELKELVRTALAQGSLERMGGYRAPVDGARLLWVDGVALAVAETTEGIRVMAANPRPELEGEALRAVQTACWVERQAAQEQKAVELLRSRGWTCIPPQHFEEGA